MKKKMLYLIMLVIFTGCMSSRKARQQKPLIELFREIITGDFDNLEQIREEEKNGNRKHPYARHVNRVADEKIDNIPEELKKGFFLLEESYYDYPGKSTEIKPYLFHFAPEGDSLIRLTVYQIPEKWDKKEIRNDNPALRFDYKELKISPTFDTAIYHYRNGSFYTHSVKQLPGGMRFSLIENLSYGRLEVMELLEKNGERITPYDTPIIYIRK
ncbi:MAG: chromophore lyase CpcT/CpeT [Chitinophagaceae bacterium]|nr:chromophore lyase CpcT/CpeT [Chitinophagaceae bacterium]